MDAETSGRRVFALLAACTIGIGLLTLYPFSFSGSTIDGSLFESFDGLDEGVLSPIAAWLVNILLPGIEASSPPTQDLWEPIGNVALFMPLGAVLVFVLRRFTRSGLAILGASLVVGLSLSLLVECVQVWLPERHPSLTDVVTNVLGALLGAAVVLVRWRGRFAWSTGLITTAGILTLGVFLTGISLYFAHFSDGWSLENWSRRYHLLIGNEMTGDRPWEGSVARVSIADRAFDPDSFEDVLARCVDADDGCPSLHRSYAFDATEGAESTFEAAQSAEDVLVWASSAARVGEHEYAEVGASNWLMSRRPVRDVSAAIAASGQFSVQAEIRPELVHQEGPARIVSISESPAQRNLTIGQQRQALYVRVRTPFTGENGSFVQFVLSDVFRETEWQTATVSYRPSSVQIGSSVGERTAEMSLTPEVRAVLATFGPFVSSFAVDVEQASSFWFRLLYYALPIGVLAALLYLRRAVLGWRQAITILVAVVFASQLVLVGAVSLEKMLVNSLICVIAGAVVAGCCAVARGAFRRSEGQSRAALV